MAQLDMEGVYMRMLRMCERASCTTKVGVQIFEFKIQQTQINSFWKRKMSWLGGVE